MAKLWNSEELLKLARSFQPACVLTAAADLDVFSRLYEKPMTAHTLATGLNIDLRAITILLDALVAMELLIKRDNLYGVPDEIVDLLVETSPKNILPMVRHLGNCLRRWAQLSEVVQTGNPAERKPSIRGRAADQAAFIGAMQNISEPVADMVIKRLKPLKFDHLLDVGGASGAWTIALLRAVSQAKATLFDLPPVIPMAKKNIAEDGLHDRVTFVEGDFYIDDLPGGADLAWLGAICHQNSREQNRILFTKVHQALKDDGTLIIRDVVMDPSHTSPAGGALFAINMLVSTEGGGTYSFEEYRHDLCAAGFEQIELVYHDEHMNSLIKAKKTSKQIL
jgi:precorrin-6B methylase 2